MKHVLATSLAIAGLATLAASQAMAATHWIMATPYAPSEFMTRNIMQFADDVGKYTNGEVVIEVHPSGALFAQPQIKRAVQTGQIQLGEINMTSYGNDFPFFDLDSTPYVVTSYEGARKLLDLTRPILNDYFDKQNIVALFSVPFPELGAISKVKIESLDDIKGLRIRSGGTASSLFAEMLGATPTVLQASEVAQAFSLGTVDAQFTSASTGFATQAWDYSKYFVDLNMAHSKNMVMLNKDAFNALSKENQAAVMKASAEAEARGWQMSVDEGVKAKQTLVDHGMVVLTPSPEFKASLQKVARKLAEDWAKRAGPEGEKVLQELGQ
jgi:TRAP-type C4-dicarboxylate transport system substrate-binding protein